MSCFQSFRMPLTHQSLVVYLPLIISHRKHPNIQPHLLMSQIFPPTYRADKAGHVVDDAAGQVERDVRLDGHEVKDDLAREAGHMARGTRTYREEGRLSSQHLQDVEITVSVILY